MSTKAVDLSHAFKVGTYSKKEIHRKRREHPKVERTSSSFARSGERVNRKRGTVGGILRV